MVIQPCEAGFSDAFLMQRYVAFARCRERQWLFCVYVSDDSLLAAPGKWH